jgi:hypothetical protein
MSGEPLFKCPKFGLTGISYCYSCSNFNGLKKDRQGNLGECDLYPGARDRVVAQVARQQPDVSTGKLTKEELTKMGVRNINDEIPISELAKSTSFVPRSVGGVDNKERIKRGWENNIQARNLDAVEGTFGKSVKRKR